MSEFEPFLCERCEWNYIEKEENMRYFTGKKICKCCFDYIIKDGVDNIIHDSYVYYSGYLLPDSYRLDGEIATKKLIEFIKQIVSNKKEKKDND